MPDWTAFTLTPRDPIMLRDARPFSADPGARAVTLDWPLPQTLAGAIRSHIGTQSPQPFDWQTTGPARARAIDVLGPLPLTRREDEAGYTVHLPAPRDGLLHQPAPGADGDETASETLAVQWLRPAEPQTDGRSGCDLPDGLRPLRVEEDVKPEQGIAFWSVDDLKDWLLLRDPRNARPPRRYVRSLPRDVRVHVSIGASTRTNVEGALFTTASLAFSDRPTRAGTPDEPAMAMLCRVRADFVDWTGEGIIRMGGEGRTAQLQRARGMAVWPRHCADLSRAVSASPRIRLQLVTPAIFPDGGWRPDWIDAATLEGRLPGLDLPVRLVGAAVGRRIPISSWTLDESNGRRPGHSATRFAVPAGSVYFFELPDGPIGNANQAERLWMMRSVCPDEQDRRDGFGLVVAGVW